jgi:hypothetical protein
VIESSISTGVLTVVGILALLRVIEATGPVCSVMVPTVSAQALVAMDSNSIIGTSSFDIDFTIH